ncbi:MFS transporter [Defluviimonas sp. WL0075]|uniref:MFS transporter n=1 Tax=Albidovulum sediminicola TaxID=2984331 RepID=A0ABT2YWE5_9RHOB|nr:MFS transporter [Defluviimonas sp. WL0075]MCV2863201.1 MFS transporter [Defluviimonas sp. WL0075]
MAVSARKRIWGWFFFDWASQPYSTLLLTFIFAPYFAEVARAHFTAAGAGPQAAAAQAQAYWTGGLTAAGIVIAILAPILGAVADGSGNRMGWIRGFSGLYILAAFALWWTGATGGLFWPVVFFGLGLIAMEFATIFTNALMPHLAVREELGRVSGSGFAFGYAGGVLALFLVLGFFAENAETGRTFLKIPPVLGLDPALREGTRAVGPFTAIWYALFMIPFFLWVAEPLRPKTHPARRALARLWDSLKALPRRRSLAAYLASSMFYRDALNAIYGLGGAFASNVLGWSVTQSGTFGVIAAITAAAACWAGGRLDGRLGPKPVIIGCILVLIAVCVTLMGLSRDTLFGVALAEGSALPDQIFYLCGALIGAAGGVLQASSRTLMVYHADPDRAAEAFGLYGLSGKATSFLAPALITAATAMTGSARLGIAPLIPLLGLGLVLLIWVAPKGDR